MPALIWKLPYQLIVSNYLAKAVTWTERLRHTNGRKHLGLLNTISFPQPQQKQIVNDLVAGSLPV